jgi:hypothetical protein
VFVANVWSKPLTLNVEYQGVSANLDAMARVASGNGASITYAPLPEGKVPPGEVAILFLAGDTNGFVAPCPPGIVPVATNPYGEDGAFHVTTDYPAAVYDIAPYGGGDSKTTGAALLFPTTAWGDNYVTIDPYRYAPTSMSRAFSLQIVAKEATELTIVPAQDVAADPGDGTPALSANTPETISLDRGKTLTLWTNVGDGLTGSIVRSDKPVGVWTMGMLGIGGCCADHAHQQIPPVQALGSEYAGVRYRNRYDGIEESPPWRIMGTVDGTKLSYEPSPPPGAPTALKAGEVAQFETADPFVVRSQDDLHPIYVAAHMNGAATYGTDNDDLRGDPEFVNVVPSKQYLSSYVFFTDPTYPETDLVVIRAAAGGSFDDVILDCAGVLTDWENMGTSGQYQFTRVDLVRHNFEPQSYGTSGLCDNGRHEIHSTKPFGITVWGWGSKETGRAGAGFNSQSVSYAYPGGQSVRSVNSVVIPPVPK